MRRYPLALNKSYASASQDGDVVDKNVNDDYKDKNDDLEVTILNTTDVETVILICVNKDVYLTYISNLLVLGSSGCNFKNKNFDIV